MVRSLGKTKGKKPQQTNDNNNSNKQEICERRKRRECIPVWCLVNRSNCSSDWKQGSPASSTPDYDQMHSRGWITSILFPLLVFPLLIFGQIQTSQQKCLTCALKKNILMKLSSLAMCYEQCLCHLACCALSQFRSWALGVWVGTAVQHHPSPTSAGAFPLEGTSLHQTRGRQARVIQTVVMLRGLGFAVRTSPNQCEKINTQPWHT